MKKADFDKKLRNFNNNVTSNKSKHIEVKKKLNDYLTSYAEVINDISKEVKLISANGSGKDLKNGLSIFNDTKHFPEDEPKNYFVFQPLHCILQH